MDKKIKEYIVIYSDDTKNRIDNLVQDAINRGYQPFGSLTVVMTPQGWRQYYQPMVKYE